MLSRRLERKEDDFTKNGESVKATKTLHRVCALLPCAPGVTLLLGGAVEWLIDRPDFQRASQLLLAGGAVTLAGLVVGACVSWRLNHPRPVEEDEEPLPPQ